MFSEKIRKVFCVCCSRNERQNGTFGKAINLEESGNRSHREKILCILRGVIKIIKKICIECKNEKALQMAKTSMNSFVGLNELLATKFFSAHFQDLVDKTKRLQIKISAHNSLIIRHNVNVLTVCTWTC